ncbi:hypothetical protein V8F33_011956 [Rhypophila sp. PSN 637]
MVHSGEQVAAVRGAVQDSIPMQDLESSTGPDGRASLEAGEIPDSNEVASHASQNANSPCQQVQPQRREQSLSGFFFSHLCRLTEGNGTSLTRLFAAAGFGLACLGLWPTITAMRDARKAQLLAEWTAKKDFLEFCESKEYDASGCDVASDTALGPPPGFGKRNLLLGRILYNRDGQSHSGMIVMFAIACTLAVHFLSAAVERPGLSGWRTSILGFVLRIWGSVVLEWCTGHGDWSEIVPIYVLCELGGFALFFARRARSTVLARYLLLTGILGGLVVTLVVLVEGLVILPPHVARAAFWASTLGFTFGVIVVETLVDRHTD